jgi:arylsulfatase
LEARRLRTFDLTHRKDDATVDPAFGRVGKQVIENTGALGKKRMETVDEEFLASAKDFITRQHKAGKPWFCYFNTTRMHIFTHLKKESAGKTGFGLYPDGMVETDGHVGQLLQLLDDLGVANSTVVVYTTDNGAETVTFPDGGATPFRGEKGTNYEGGFRVPCLIDFIPTFAAAAGEPGIVEKLRSGSELNGKKFRVHLDGHNLLPFLKGEIKESPREGFLYWSDDGDLLAIRVKYWKLAFMEQHAEIGPSLPIGVWQGQITKLRAPVMYNLRADPFERGPESILYGRWMVEHIWAQVPIQFVVKKWIDSFKEFPPRAKAASFTVSDVMEKITTASPHQN